MKILFASAYLPYPPDTGGRIRTYHLLRWAAEHHEVHLLSFYHHASQLKHLPHLKDFCQKIRTVPAPVWGTAPLSRLTRALRSPGDIVIPRRSANMERALRASLSEGGFDLVHFDDLGLASYARLSSSLPTVLSKHNIEWMIKRRIMGARRPLSKGKWMALLEWLALWRYEGRAASLFERVIVVSEVDRWTLARRPMPNISVLPNGVDTEYFSPHAEVRGRQGIPDELSLVFTGAMFWPPNIDASLFLCREITPLIRRHVPEVKVYIVGQDPPQAVRNLGKEPGVVVTGYVKDVRPYLAHASLYVAPLRIGSGTRLKILEALAMGKAVVTTTIGREGLNLVMGREIVVANRAETFASAVCDLLRDTDRRAKLGRAGRVAVEARYDWRFILPRLELVYREAVQAHKRKASPEKYTTVNIPRRGAP